MTIEQQQTTAVQQPVQAAPNQAAPNQAAPAQAAPAQAAQPDHLDLFADHITEELLGAMLNDAPQAQAPQPQAPQPQAPQPQAPQPQAPQPLPEQPEPAQKAAGQLRDEGYNIELFGQTATFSGEQLMDLCEAGTQLLTHRPQIEQAMKLLETVNNNPKLKAVLDAHREGRPLPVVGQPHNPAPVPSDDPAVQMRQQLAQELKQQLMEEIQAHYKPFVENVQAFAAKTTTEREFARLAAEPDFKDSIEVIESRIKAAVASGEFTLQHLARYEHALKTDPAFFRGQLGLARQALAIMRAQHKAPLAAGSPQRIDRAPRLEGAASMQADADTESRNQLLSRALGGDVAALGALL